MELTQYDIFAYQILHYLVVKQNYQIVRVQQHQDDLWLMNARQERFPVIRISSKSNAGTLSDTEYIRNVHRLILNLIHREGPIMIFNTNPDSTPIDNEVMTQIRITPSEISNEEITKVFKDIDHILHDVDDYRNELAFLSKEVEEIQLKRQSDLLKKTEAKKLPKITIGIMIFSAIYSLLAIGLTLYLQDTAVAAVILGAFYKMNIVAAHEYWRIISAGFLHIEPMSLIVNLYALYSIGKYCEQLFTKLQFLVIMFIAMIVGNVFLLIGEVNVVAGGLSGSIFGLFGAYMTVLIAHRTIRHPLVKLSLFNIFWAMILVVLFSNISVFGLIGSIVSGVLLGLMFDTNSRWIHMKIHVKIAGSIALLLLGYMGIMVRHVDPLSTELNTNIIYVYRHAGMNWYADYLQRSYQKQYRME